MQHTLIRQHFPLIQNSDLIYFDNAATTQKPASVINAINQYYQFENANVHRGAHQLSNAATTSFENARKNLQQFINALHWQEIIWTKGATEAINLVAYAWGDTNLNSGDSIIISAAEHHANLVPWQQLCARTGATLAVINLTETGELDLSHYTSLLNNQPKLVAIPHISNVLGLSNPIQEMTMLAHQTGAKVLIDGAQSLAHEPIDVQVLNCDFFVASAHKAYGPTGIGFLYGKKSLLENMRPWQFGGEMISKVSFQETTFNEPPFLFEAGTPPIAEAIGFSAALSFLQQQSFHEAQVNELRCLEALYSGLKAIPRVKPIGALTNRRSLVSFTIDNIHPYDLGQLLNQRGVAIRSGHHCAMPLMDVLGLTDGCARASLGIYNTTKEVERFLENVESIAHPTVHSRATKTPLSEDNKTDNSSQLLNDLKALKSWQEKLNYLTKHAQTNDLSALPDQDKTDDKLLHGCTSKVWLDYQFNQSQQTLSFQLAADSKIIKGLAAVVLSRVNGKTAEEIILVDIDKCFTELGLKQHLSPSRSNGIHTIATAIKTIASEYCSI